MSTALRSVRLIAASAARGSKLRVVNVKFDTKLAAHEACQQVTGDQGRSVPTYIDSGGNVAGLKTIYINSYAGVA